MLNTPYCYLQSQRFTHGIANRDLGLTRMVRIRLFIPPLALQRAFASWMSALDRVKFLQRTGLQHLDTLVDSLQHRAFAGEL